MVKGNHVFICKILKKKKKLLNAFLFSTELGFHIFLVEFADHFFFLGVFDENLTAQLCYGVLNLQKNGSLIWNLTVLLSL